VTVKCLSSNHPSGKDNKLKLWPDQKHHIGFARVLLSLWGVKEWRNAIDERFFMIGNDTKSIGHEIIDEHGQERLNFRRKHEVLEKFKGFVVYLDPSSLPYSKKKKKQI